MKRKILILLLFLFLLIAGFEVYAHPGRTDDAGGHTNRSTGEYHYHHGYPAHQHPNGECPYAIKNDDGKQIYPNNTSNGTANIEKSNNVISNDENENNFKNEKQKTDASMASEKRRF